MCCILSKALSHIKVFNGYGTEIISLSDLSIVNIDLPEGYKVESLPENAVFNLGEDMDSFRYLISQIGNKLQLSVELSINKSFITYYDTI